MSTTHAVQATVYRFDSTTGSGSALLDNGSEVTFTGAAFAAGGLRLLRSGQRVRLDIAEDDVVRVTLYTLPD